MTINEKGVGGGEGNKRRQPAKSCDVKCSAIKQTQMTLASTSQFPGVDDELQQTKWIAFVLAKRDDDWIPATGHICCNHFCS